LTNFRQLPLKAYSCGISEALFNLKTDFNSAKNLVDSGGFFFQEVFFFFLNKKKLIFMVNYKKIIFIIYHVNRIRAYNTLPIQFSKKLRRYFKVLQKVFFKK